MPKQEKVIAVDTATMRELHATIQGGQAGVATWAAEHAGRMHRANKAGVEHLGGHGREISSMAWGT